MPKLKVLRSSLSAMVVKKPTGSAGLRTGFANTLRDMPSQKHNPKSQTYLPIFGKKGRAAKILNLDFTFEMRHEFMLRPIVCRVLSRRIPTPIHALFISAFALRSRPRQLCFRRQFTYEFSHHHLFHDCRRVFDFGGRTLVGLVAEPGKDRTVVVFSPFLAGAFARTKLAQKGVNWLEAAVLSNLPGYEFVKSVSQDLLAVENQQVYPVALARGEDCWQIAFLIERTVDGQAANFVPGVPSPQSVSLYFITEDRVKPVDIPSSSVLKCLERHGLGSNALMGKWLSPPLSIGF